MRKIGRERAEHYVWKERCDGWHLVKRDDLSVIAEKMPPRTAEDMHRHLRSRQFFYMLSGQGVMRLAGGEETLLPGEEIEIAPGEPHQMTNPSEGEIEFLVISMPKAHGDRELCTPAE